MHQPGYYTLSKNGGITPTSPPTHLNDTADEYDTADENSKSKDNNSCSSNPVLRPKPPLHVSIASKSHSTGDPMTEPDFSSQQLSTGGQKDDLLFQTVSGLSNNNSDVSEETTLQQNGNESNERILEKNLPSGTINNVQTNDDPLDSYGDELGSNCTNVSSSTTLERSLTIERRDLVMHRNFGDNYPSTIGVCTLLSCGGSWCHCISHLPNIKMGHKSGRKRGRSGGASNKYSK